MKNRRDFFKSLVAFFAMLIGTKIPSVQAETYDIKKLSARKKVKNTLPFTSFKRGEIVKRTVAITDFGYDYNYFGVFVGSCEDKKSCYILWGNELIPISVLYSDFEKVELSTLTEDEFCSLAELEEIRKMVMGTDRLKNGKFVPKEGDCVDATGLKGTFLGHDTNPAFTTEMAEVEFYQTDQYKSFVASMFMDDVKFLSAKRK